jgi:hypothetical protein
MTCQAFIIINRQIRMLRAEHRNEVDAEIASRKKAKAEIEAMLAAAFSTARTNARG